MVSNREDATHDTDIVYPSAIPFVLVHLICIAAIWTGITWQAVTIGIVLYWVRIFAIGAGYHRYFSHRAYATSRAFQFVLAVLSQSTAQKSVLWWAAKHRHHHLHSDTECDVHSPRHKGFLYSHLGWIFSRRHHKADLVKVAGGPQVDTRLNAIARPINEVPTARPEEDLAGLIERIGMDLEKRVLVYSNGQLVGILSPVDVARVLTVRTGVGRV